MAPSIQWVGSATSDAPHEAAVFPARPRTRRMADKHALLLSERPMYRYRLAVVATRRPAPGKPPRARVVVYLGIADEAQLHPAFGGRQQAFDNRNVLVPRFQKRLRQAVADGRMTEEERVAMHNAIGRAFPNVQPPPGLSYVVIPARVFERAVKRFEADVQAFSEQRQWAAIAKKTGRSVESVPTAYAPTTRSQRRSASA